MLACLASAAVIRQKQHSRSAAFDAHLENLIERLMRCATTCEPSVTELLRAIAAENSGTVVGLEFKFKSKDSLLRKARSVLEEAILTRLEEGEGMGEAEENVEMTADEIIWTSLRDALRYTISFPTATYVEGVRECMRALEAEGMKPLLLKNCAQRLVSTDIRISLTLSPISLLSPSYL